MTNEERFLYGAAIFLVMFIVLMAVVIVGAGQDTMRNCPPKDRWAISVWDGSDGVYVGEAMATCGGVRAVYSLDSETQEWQRWFPERPELSNMGTLGTLQGVFVLGSAEGPTATLTATPAAIPEKTATVAAPTPTKSPSPTIAATETSIATSTASPTRSPTPLPSATPTQITTPGPTLQFFSGDGDGSVESFPLWQGRAVFSFTYEGMFYVGLYDPDGIQLEWFRGGERRVTIPEAGDYTMEVQAQRPWTITVRQ